MQKTIIYIGIISISFIIFGCFETALAQEAQEPDQTPWASLKALRQMKQDVQSITKDVKNGINYLKGKAQEKVSQGKKGIREQLKDGLKDYGRSFSTQIKWGIDKVKEGVNKIKYFFVNLFQKFKK